VAEPESQLTENRAHTAAGKGALMVPIDVPLNKTSSWPGAPETHDEIQAEKS
jgi:hypothetical protein